MRDYTIKLKRRRRKWREFRFTRRMWNRIAVIFSLGVAVGMWVLAWLKLRH
jgi:hypothetical protein